MKKQNNNSNQYRGHFMRGIVRILDLRPAGAFSDLNPKEGQPVPDPDIALEDPLEFRGGTLVITVVLN